MVLFASCAFLQWRSPAPGACQTEKQPLAKVLNHIPGWKNDSAVTFETNLINALKLDDYINIRYSNTNTQVSLYIGQYLSPEKVGAAHNPLVCLPGQGWKVSGRDAGEISVPFNNKTYPVSYNTMVAELGDVKQLFLYWFQASDATYANTLGQKVSVFWNILLGRSPDSALVRLSTPLNGQSRAEAKAALLKFAADFYPVYLTYIQSPAAQ
ncbi:MAG: EpsI family protein [Thermodesulfobacteriota bacterium]|nr:EpsI family protein [Thermodesulfobacteriota bacterium]